MNVWYGYDALYPQGKAIILVRAQFIVPLPLNYNQKL